MKKSLLALALLTIAGTSFAAGETLSLDKVNCYSWGNGGSSANAWSSCDAPSPKIVERVVERVVYKDSEPTVVYKEVPRKKKRE